MFSFLCCVFGGVRVVHMFSFLCFVLVGSVFICLIFCVVFGGIRVAYMFSFLCCVFGGVVLFICLVFCVVFLVGSCGSYVLFSVLCFWWGPCSYV